MGGRCFPSSGIDVIKSSDEMCYIWSCLKGTDFQQRSNERQALCWMFTISIDGRNTIEVLRLVQCRRLISLKL